MGDDVGVIGSSFLWARHLLCRRELMGHVFIGEWTCFIPKRSSLCSLLQVGPGLSHRIRCPGPFPSKGKETLRSRS